MYFCPYLQTFYLNLYNDFQIPIDSFSSLKKKKIAMSEDEKKNRS